MTVAEYLAASAGWEVRYEYVNGEILAMSGGRPRHAAVIANVAVALGSRLRGRPCRVASSDLRIHVPETDAWLYPDLTVIRGPWETAPDDPISVTNPSAVVEVLSPSTRDYDRGEGWLRMDRSDGDVELRALGITVPVDAIYAELENVPDA